MKTKFRKAVKIFAAMLFLVALAINIKATLNDPFTRINEEALAYQSSGYGGGDCSGCS
ncbi:hypothetical protein [Sinomicrobium sp. M5D2P17]